MEIFKEDITLSKAIQKMEPIQAIDRAFQVLETISRTGNMTLAE